MWRRSKQKHYIDENVFPEHPAGAGHIRPQDIQEKEFRLAFRGYNERDVDVFLDELTDEVARLRSENDRLRREGDNRGTERLDAGAAVEAEAIVRRARDEAARIVSQAENEASRIESEARAHADELRARAANEAASRGREAPRATTPDPRFASAFLSRERAFLQSLAGLIQDHAEAVKADLRRATEAAGTEAAARGEAGRRLEATPPPTSVTRTAPATAAGEPATGRPSAPPADPGIAGDRGATVTQPLARPAAPSAEPGDSNPPPGARAPSPEDAEGAGNAPSQANRDKREGEESRSLKELFWGQD